MTRTEALVCFVHIERAGGTTIHSVLRTNMPLGFLTLTPWPDWPNEPGTELGIDELRLLMKLCPYASGFGGHTTRSYSNYETALGRPIRYFTFVRDPVKRYLSHYRHQRYRKGVQWRFESFLAESRFDNYMTRRIAGRDDVELAKRRLREDFAFVGLTERFMESLVLMNAAIGGRRWCVLHEKENSSIGLVRDADVAVDAPDMLRLVAARNRLDQELYEFVREELYPAQVERFGVTELRAEMEALTKGNESYRFPRWRRWLWQAHRQLYYRHVEWVVHCLAR